MDRVGPITSELLNICIKEARKDENQKKINEILDPFIEHIMIRIQPYILVTSCTFVIVIILFIVIIYLLITTSKSIKNSS